VVVVIGAGADRDAAAGTGYPAEGVEVAAETADLVVVLGGVGGEWGNAGY
jgi:hypothetical protein